MSQANLPLDEIRKRWRWDKVRATDERIRLALRRTGNCYGITVSGYPYLAPHVGMKVRTNSGYNGKIIEVRKPMVRGGDPEVAIKTPKGIHYLFQTALNGYRIA